MRYSIQILTTATLSIAAAHSQAACLDGEETFMSCQIENSENVLRVCFDETTTYYRFGQLSETPQLELSEPIATVAYSPWSGVGRSIAEGVKFDNEEYAYETYAGFERMFGDEEFEDIPHRFFGGVRVARDDSIVADLSCVRKSVEFVWGEGLWTAKHNLGFVWDDLAREWVELPD